MRTLKHQVNASAICSKKRERVSSDATPTPNTSTGVVRTPIPEVSQYSTFKTRNREVVIDLTLMTMDYSLVRNL